jgi:1-deoxy-D-xylulose-5-phosphate synthase
MSLYPLLDTVTAPQQIQYFSLPQLEQLAFETRQFLINSISKTGGHLSSNLGTVELTIALACKFDFLLDKIIWDVGHQTYPYKILTGRKDLFHTLRSYGGLSGFQKREESRYDHFGAGHSSTSISSALGVAIARDLQKHDFACISVIGDGSMTAGMAFEGLNQAGFLKTNNFMVILNDNDMSINPNVGSLQGYLNQMISGQYYKRWQDRIENAIKAIPVVSIRTRLARAVKWSEESFKRIAVPGLLFEDLGFSYLGPVNGHSLSAMLKIIDEAKKKMLTGPVLLHVQTKKGFGYTPALNDPLKWHGVTTFDVELGEIRKSVLSPNCSNASTTYTSVFGKALTELARLDHKIVAVTAAMLDGTGLNTFQEVFPDRCFDVGIAEQHAVTFAAGLAVQGMRPVVAIYSTFLQRGFDQLFHDVCLQNLPVTFVMDRSGLVGADGPTHHGLYDMAYLRCLPNLIMMAPKDANELRQMLMTAIYSKCPTAIRYPRGNTTNAFLVEPIVKLPIGQGELVCEGSDLLLVAIGTMVDSAIIVADRLATEGISCAVINARFIKPLDTKLILRWACSTKKTVVMEEGCMPGGFTSAVSELFSDTVTLRPLLRCAVPDHIVQHGERDVLMDEQQLSIEALTSRIRKFFAR